MAIRSFAVNTKTGAFTPIQSTDFGWCVIKHRPRGNILEDTNAFDPDEIILQDAPVGDSLGNGIPYQSWWPTSDRVNTGNQKAINWLNTYEAEFFNNDQGEQREIDRSKPINIRCSTGGGNLKKYYKGTQTNTHIQIYAFDYRYPQLADGMDFTTNPEMFIFPVAINLSGRIIKVAGGVDVYVPQICRPQGLWIRKSEVVFLDEKPTTWDIQNVMSPTS